MHTSLCLRPTSDGPTTKLCADDVKEEEEEEEEEGGGGEEAQQAARNENVRCRAVALAMEPAAAFPGEGLIVGGMSA